MFDKSEELHVLRDFLGASPGFPSPGQVRSLRPRYWLWQHARANVRAKLLGSDVER